GFRFHANEQVVANDASVIDQNVNSAPQFGNLLDTACSCGSVRYVRLECNNCAVRLADLLDQAVCGGLATPINESHLRALLRKSSDDGSTDSSAASCNQCYLILKSHNPCAKRSKRKADGAKAHLALVICPVKRMLCCRKRLMMRSSISCKAGFRSRKFEF